MNIDGEKENHTQSHAYKTSVDLVKGQPFPSPHSAPSFLGADQFLLSY